MPSDYLKLFDIVSRGPLIRGTQEWEDRELARAVLGCRCMSHGTIAEARAREMKRKIQYHYMIDNEE